MFREIRNPDRILKIAINEIDFSAIKKAISQGANVNLKGDEGRSALLVASYYGKIGLVNYLLKKGADVNTFQGDGSTALYAACERGSLEVVKILLKNGANLNLANIDGDTPIFMAISKRYHEIVKILIAKGAKVNFRNKDGHTLLIKAIQTGEKRMVKYLLNKNANVDLSDSFERTPLWVASFLGFLDIVNILVEEGADINLANKNGASPLKMAAQGGHLEIVESLLKAKANVDFSDIENDGNPLSIAVQYGFLDVVEVLLKAGANINWANNKGVTALFIACSSGNLEMVQILLEAGADPNLANNKGVTPIQEARSMNYMNIVTLLEKGKIEAYEDFDKGSEQLIEKQNPGKNSQRGRNKKGKKRKNRSGQGKNKQIFPKRQQDLNSGLFGAVMEKELLVVQALIKEGANINYVFETGEPIFWTANFFGFIECVRHLLKLGVDINLVDLEQGLSPLAAAIMGGGYLEIVKILLKKGADINLQDKEKNTPLLNAAENGYLEIVHILLDYKADVNIPNFLGVTPLMVASYLGYIKIVKAILAVPGVLVDFQSKSKDTALSMAIKGGHLEIVKQLVEAGADINLVNVNGESPLFLASSLGHLDAVNLLIEQGANIELKNRDGLTAFEIAKQEGHDEVVETLLQAFKSKVNYGPTEKLPLEKIEKDQSPKIEILNTNVECDRFIRIEYNIRFNSDPTQYSGKRKSITSNTQSGSGSISVVLHDNEKEISLFSNGISGQMTSTFDHNLMKESRIFSGNFIGPFTRLNDSLAKYGFSKNEKLSSLKDSCTVNIPTVIKQVLDRPISNYIEVESLILDLSRIEKKPFSVYCAPEILLDNIDKGITLIADKVKIERIEEERLLSLLTLSSKLGQDHEDEQREYFSKRKEQQEEFTRREKQIEWLEGEVERDRIVEIPELPPSVASKEISLPTFGIELGEKSLESDELLSDLSGSNRDSKLSVPLENTSGMDDRIELREQNSKKRKKNLCLCTTTAVVALAAGLGFWAKVSGVDPSELAKLFNLTNRM